DELGGGGRDGGARQRDLEVAAQTVAAGEAREVVLRGPQRPRRPRERRPRRARGHDVTPLLTPPPEEVDRVLELLEQRDGLQRLIQRRLLGLLGRGLRRPRQQEAQLQLDDLGDARQGLRRELEV